MNIGTKKSMFTGGKEISVETGKLAKQADGSVVVRMGDTMLLATVVAAHEAKEGVDFLPLTVDYREKYSAAGRFPGGFFRREARPSETEILVMRLVDRALRPLFPDDYHAEVQLMIQLLAYDGIHNPDALCGFAASAAIAVSDIPFNGPMSEVRVGRVNGAYILNPTMAEMAESDIDVVIAGTMKDINMLEGEMQEISEAELVEVFKIAHEAIRKQIKAQAELRKIVGITEVRDYKKPEQDEAIREKVYAYAKAKVDAIARLGSAKHERSDAFSALKKEIIEHLGTEITDLQKKLAGKYYEDLKWEVVRDMMVDSRIRLDGRKLDEVRPLAMEIGPLPTPHGSSLFTRGETQSLTTVTLGTKLDELMQETAASAEYAKFFLHYNFPPFSTGEVKMMRGVGRREVGHGNLAMRSLKQMLPDSTVFPYTLRVVSDILESNGSSSMATVCAGSLALMDAGVPIPKHVSGVAMGLISREDGKYAILTDILGDEDHLGDMDFKVTGTRDGICGVQMDIKVDGLSMDIMREALSQARKGRLHILDAMYECTPAARADVKPHAPRMVKIIIDKEFIGAVIGPGGKIIQEMQRTTGATINIEEVGNNGEVSIFSANKESLDAAVRWINSIVAVPEIGDEYEGVVKGVKEFGAFVEFMPGKQGLLHISEISWKRLETMEGIFNEGDTVKVKLIGLDPKTGKFKLSHKALLPRPEQAPREDRGPQQ